MISYTFCTCVCGVVSDLNKVLVRSAPRTIVPAEEIASAGTRITVEVIEPEEEYRIPRQDPSPKPAPRVHYLSKMKAAVLADKVAKQELNKKK